MKTIITTIGTSLLTNKSDDRPWKNLNVKNKFPEMDEVVEWLLSADLKRASAEIHTWQKLGVFASPANHKIILLCSQTPDGKFCAKSLNLFLNEKKIQSSIIEIKELNYKSSAHFNKGLSQLIKTIAENIKANYRNSEVLIAATGGFKAEIAVANLTGLLLGIPVYYIYEQFEELIKLTPLPLQLSMDWLKDSAGKKFIDILHEKDCIVKTEIDSFLKVDSRLDLLLEEDEEEKIVCLNPLGELATQILNNSTSVEWPKNSLRSPEEKIQLQKTSHHRPKNYEKIIEKIANMTFITNIRYNKLAGENAGIKISDNDFSKLLMVIQGKDQSGRNSILPLEISTTAENRQQSLLILEYIKKKMNIK